MESRTRKIFALAVLLAATHFVSAQSISGGVVPQYMQGLNGSNNDRVPAAAFLSLTGLNATSTYRYFNRMVDYTDGSTSNGAGNIYYVTPDSFYRSTALTPSFSTPGEYGEFTTDASGNYSGWFMNEPTGNPRFTPGAYVHLRVMLNDGAGGTTVVTRVTTNDSVRVINFGTTAGDTLQGSAIYDSCTTGSTTLDRNFVLLYDNISGSGNPVSCIFIETDSVDVSSVTSYSAFYRSSVDNRSQWWGTIIPNNLTNGIRRLEYRSVYDGTIIDTLKDADGLWASGVDTRNPSNGTTGVYLNSLSGVTGIKNISIKENFYLSENFPNPSKGETEIIFSLTKAQHADLILFDMTGRKISVLFGGIIKANEQQKVRVNTSALSNGMYFYQLQTSSGTITKKMSVAN